MSDAEAAMPLPDQVDDEGAEVRGPHDSHETAGPTDGDGGDIERAVAAEPEPVPAEPERSEADRLADDLETDLVGVDDALKRLDDGSYGTCTTCGAPLDDIILAENPTISVCQPACAQPPETRPTTG